MMNDQPPLQPAREERAKLTPLVPLWAWNNWTPILVILGLAAVRVMFQDTGIHVLASLCLATLWFWGWQISKVEWSYYERWYNWVKERHPESVSTSVKLGMAYNKHISKLFVFFAVWNFYEALVTLMKVM